MIDGAWLGCQRSLGTTRMPRIWSGGIRGMLTVRYSPALKPATSGLCARRTTHEVGRILHQAEGSEQDTVGGVTVQAVGHDAGTQIAALHGEVGSALDADEAAGAAAVLEGATT
jgi:hypothetical protein